MRNEVYDCNLTLFWDLDGTLAAWQESTLEERLTEGYFLNLPSEKRLCELANEWARCSYILTSYYAHSKYALKEKGAWRRMHLPAYTDEHTLFVPYGIDKALFVRDLLRRPLTPTDILVDDHSPNLLRWQQAGGTGIKWCNKFNNSGRSLFCGPRTGRAEEVRKLIEDSSVKFNGAAPCGHAG